MKKFYACLAGNWVCLNDNPKSMIVSDLQTTLLKFDEGVPKYDKLFRHLLLEAKSNIYIYVYYKGARYKISPVFIQIVDDDN